MELGGDTNKGVGVGMGGEGSGTAQFEGGMFLGEGRKREDKEREAISILQEPWDASQYPHTDICPKLPEAD